MFFLILYTNKRENK